MLITLCYSVLTWIQSRQRSEISAWVQKALGGQSKGKVEQQAGHNNCSIVCLRRDFTLSFSLATWTPSSAYNVTSTTSADTGTLDPTEGLDNETNNELVLSNSSSGISTPSILSNLPHSSSGGNNKEVVGREGPLSPTSYEDDEGLISGSNIPCSGTTNDKITSKTTTNILERVSAIAGSVLSRAEISDLCYNFQATKLRRLLWEEESTKALIVTPTLNVNLHEWISFREDTCDLLAEEEPENGNNASIFEILLEAESTLPYNRSRKDQNRKFAQFGKLVAWRYNNVGQFALIIQSHLNQLIDLMHIFRLGIFVLEGGWKVHRLSTIKCEGTAGTLISIGKSTLSESKKFLCPGDLRKLSVGIFDCRESDISESLTSTPKSSISKNISKHDITTISEEPFDDELLEASTPLANWFERTPKKRSTLPNFPKNSSSTGRRRFSSFCSGGSVSGTGKSSSLASLKLAGKSLSVDEEVEPEPVKVKNWMSSSKSFESLSLSAAPSLPLIMGDTSASGNLLSPGDGVSRSLSSSPRRFPSKKSPNKRIGKPNILILSDNEGRSDEIGNIMKKLLSRERYAIYNIRWDQLEVGGWSDQAALLVVAGHIPKPSFILEYLGDGGKLLGWCCEDSPFGATLASSTKGIVEYGPSPPKITRPLILTGKSWGVPSPPNKHPPEFKKVLETVDSEGYARPLTVSVYATVQGSKEPLIVQLDGGALGGKGFLSQIPFEKCTENEDALALLSSVLGQNLGLDCSQVGGADFTQGYLLGDHKRVMDFLASTPATVEQPELTLEFVPRGEKGSRPSHLRLPVYILMCPPNFSTLHYYDNLESKLLGRVVIYTDTITSTMNVLRGHSLLPGLTVIAARQTSGRGRGRNIWLSPEGCASFSVQLNIQMNSSMGQRISLIQHIAALAVVLAIPNHTELKLGVKWPNDIYAGEEKIGGILVESRIEGQKAIVNVGIGVNVANPHPTVCLNSLMPAVGQPNSSAVDKKGKSPGSSAAFRVETVIAKTLTKLEELLDNVEKEPIERLLDLYQQNWIHSSEDEVSVEMTEGVFSTCQILGVDEYGFLRAVQVDTGNVFSVRPDGNSFDITNKLIAIKQ